MNEITKAILDHEYKDGRMNKQKFIFKRTKKKRIKDKSFNKLFYAFMEERQVAIIGEIVIMNNEYYLELKKMIEKPVEAPTEMCTVCGEYRIYNDFSYGIEPVCKYCVGKY